MTGLELAGELRKTCPGLPVVLVSGFSERIDKEKVEKAGIQSSVVKPATPRDLARAIRRVLDQDTCPASPEEEREAPAET